MTSIKISKVNYFGEGTNINEWNAKVLYYVDAKLELAYIYIDFFNRHVFVSKKQDPTCKIAKGFEFKINEFAEQTNWTFESN